MRRVRLYRYHNSKIYHLRPCCGERRQDYYANWACERSQVVHGMRTGTGESLRYWVGSEEVRICRRCWRAMHPGVPEYVPGYTPDPLAQLYVSMARATGRARAREVLARTYALRAEASGAYHYAARLWRRLADQAAELGEAERAAEARTEEAVCLRRAMEVE